MKHIDLRNAIESPGTDNFSCLLFRIILKADGDNRRKLAEAYPLEVEMANIFQNECPYMADFRVDYEHIENRARSRVGE